MRYNKDVKHIIYQLENLIILYQENSKKLKLR